MSVYLDPEIVRYALEGKVLVVHPLGTFEIKHIPTVRGKNFDSIFIDESVLGTVFIDEFSPKKDL